MSFQLDQAIEVLERTPATLTELLGNLSEDWVQSNEGADTFSPFDVVGHLIHGERTDWIPRLRIILEEGQARAFEPFDRFAMFEASRGKTLSQLLVTFKILRQENLSILRRLGLSESDLEERGEHPELGEVTLRQLLATWVTHDLTHISQIVRVMAHRYVTEVGPWRAYIRILNA